MDNFKPEKLTLHVVSPEEAVNLKWEEEWNRVSKNLELKSVDELNSLPAETRKQYFDVPSFEEGMILILDPVNKRYYPASTAYKKIPMNKFLAIRHIAELLGAKSILRREVHIEQKTRNLDTEGEVKITDFKADVSFSKEEKEEAVKDIEQITNCPGIYLPDGYRQAEEYCKQIGLFYDPEIKDILDSRHPSNPNRRNRHVHRITISNDIEEGMEAACSLNYLKYYSLRAQVKEHISKSQMIRLELIIEYGD